MSGFQSRIQTSNENVIADGRWVHKALETALTVATLSPAGHEMYVQTTKCITVQLINLFYKSQIICIAIYDHEMRSTFIKP